MFVYREIYKLGENGSKTINTTTSLLYYKMTFWKWLKSSSGNPPSYKEALGKDLASEKKDKVPKYSSTENNTQSANVTEKPKPPPRIPSESEEDEFDKNYDAEEENILVTAANDGKELARKCALYFADLDDLAVDKSTINAWQRALNKSYDEVEGLEILQYRMGSTINYNGKTHSYPFYEEFSYRLTARLSPKLGIAREKIMLDRHHDHRLKNLQYYIVSHHRFLDPDLIVRLKNSGNPMYMYI
ncbi:uncharacterized protein RJT21DRAFT_49245 [Scheffersomyces amazonensis]|uniref:uncharacterized protein n=1 Tax=Scheffersomyces amazonensis TaxID=1078765 RepID=UPI00315D8F37